MALIVLHLGQFFGGRTQNLTQFWMVHSLNVLIDIVSIFQYLSGLNPTHCFQHAALQMGKSNFTAEAVYCLWKSTVVLWELLGSSPATINYSLGRTSLHWEQCKASKDIKFLKLIQTWIWPQRWVTWCEIPMPFWRSLSLSAGTVKLVWDSGSRFKLTCA